MNRMRWALVCAGLVCVQALSVLGDDLTSPSKTAKTVKATKGTISTSAALKGIVEGEKTAEISLRPEAWQGPWTVEQIVEHGSPVKADEVLVKFDPDKLKDAVVNAREERELAVIAVKQAELELPILKQLLPIDLLAAELAKKDAVADLQDFLSIQKEHRRTSAQFSLKGSEFNLQSRKEELSQLEKMYRDKDLTEETEQMILKRHKFQVEAAEFGLVGAKILTEHQVNVEIPRAEQRLHIAANKAELNWQKSREQLPLDLRQKELSLVKLKIDERRTEERLAHLEKDLTLATLKAPFAGLAYYGKSSFGTWSGLQAQSVSKGHTIQANEPFLTIISTGKLFVRVEADEKEAAELRAGQSGRFSPVKFPGRKLEVRVQSMTSAPRMGKFSVLVEITDPAREGILPGLTGPVRISLASKESAVLVLSSAVFEDAETETSYVYLPGNSPIKKTVKVGLVSGDKTEILEGLAEGDEILAVKP